LEVLVFTSPGHDVKGGDDAGIVYHEYTHGMTNRLLCCDSSGMSLIGLTGQSGAMDEAWADWYATDFLNAEGLVPDGAAPGDIDFGEYEDFQFRSQPLDCPPGGGGSACAGASLAG
jgi:extracellular elastinolytic metalloproteinase